MCTAKFCPVTYLQVSGDGVVGSMGDQEDAIGLTDHGMTHLNLPCMPVGHSSPHGGHAQLGVVVVVQLPVEEREEGFTGCTGFSKGPESPLKLEIKRLDCIIYGGAPGSRG